LRFDAALPTAAVAIGLVTFASGCLDLRKGR
jgi:hypothetical protein